MVFSSNSSIGYFICAVTLKWLSDFNWANLYLGRRLREHLILNSSINSQIIFQTLTSRKTGILPSWFPVGNPDIWSSTYTWVTWSPVQYLLQTLGLLHLEQVHVKVNAELSYFVPAAFRRPRKAENKKGIKNFVILNLISTCLLSVFYETTMWKVSRWNDIKFRNPNDYWNRSEHI